MIHKNAQTFGNKQPHLVEEYREFNHRNKNVMGRILCSFQGHSVNF